MADQTLILKSYDEFVAAQVTAVQNSSTVLVDFTIGSILRALVEAATIALGLWLQSDAQDVLSTARLTTSRGLNVDSFLADFGQKRKGAGFASGLIKFSRFSPTIQGLVSLGASVSSLSSGQSYIVIQDTNNPNWNPTLNAYTIAISVSSAQIPVEAVTPGSKGNAIANSITTINGSVTGVDTVTNDTAFENGFDAQDDPQAKAYFVLYLASLSKATKAALEFALLEIQDVDRQNLVENKNYPSGDVHKGFIYAIADDGSGTPPQSLLNQASLAVDATRAFGIQFAVYPPVILTINVSATITIKPTANEPTITANINNSISQYLFNLEFEGFIPFSFVPNLIYDSLAVDNQAAPNTTFGRDTNILNVSAITVNGLSVDIQATPDQIMQLGTLTLNYI